MVRSRWILLGGITVLVSSGVLISRAQERGLSSQLSVQHANCTYFGPERQKYIDAALQANGRSTGRHALSEATERVTAALGYVPPGSPTYTFTQSQDTGTIDSYIFADLQGHGIAPAPDTTDWEFVRRIYLDLTGRIPTTQQVLGFVSDSDPQKRAKLVDTLLNSSQWLDKWTKYYGDLLKNTVTYPSTGLNRFAQGRNAFYSYIHDSLDNGKPYNTMVTEMLTATAPNSYVTGQLNWLVGGWIANGPTQDTFDQETSNVADTFLGMEHVNCLLCHNGRGHLDSISLWGANTTRYQAWQLASYVSHTQIGRTVVDPSNNNVYYWYLADNAKGYTNDYTLNTTTGNRPARQPATGCKSGQPCSFVQPQYIFNGDSPKPGENYRAALAREVTGDFQFARAAVNYLWAYFFGQGIVDPPDSFDPARLDPNNPPPAPWTLQPSNARLLNALASHFIQNGYNVKATMREIVNSRAYQLSARYNGTWSPDYQNYFARKYVRRLWSEEVHDAIVLSSGTYPAYKLTGFTDQGAPYPATISFAMQHPDVVGGFSTDPQAGNANNLLDAFLRGNRDDQPRKQDGSILQALNMMNGFVESRLATTGSQPSQLILSVVNFSNTDAVNTLYLSILSRYPSADELSKATAYLTGGGTHTQNLQDLAWSLYNKVDFLFNY
ncbi:MAG TPA: DUF1549 domain-containing protein [Candidatus Limnocylindrales bacterium]|nr:DUF1549 domain-containing protein [Candidatus Limnocylindrales bacterium]